MLGPSTPPANAVRDTRNCAHSSCSAPGGILPAAGSHLFVQHGVVDFEFKWPYEMQQNATLARAAFGLFATGVAAAEPKSHE
jgi:hypothetical protein